KRFDLFLQGAALGSVSLPFQGFFVYGGCEVAPILSLIVGPEIEADHEAGQARRGEGKQGRCRNSSDLARVVRFQTRAKICEHQTIGFRQIFSFFLDEVQFTLKRVDLTWWIRGRLKKFWLHRKACDVFDNLRDGLRVLRKLRVVDAVCRVTRTVVILVSRM